MSSLAATARDSALYFMARALPAGVHLGLSIVLIRRFGNDVYVEYALVLAMVLGAGVLATSWLSQSLLRGGPGSEDEAATDALVWKGGGAIVVTTFPLLWGVAELVLPPIRPNPLVLLALHAGTIAYLLALSRQIARGQPRRVLVAEAIRSGGVAMTGLLVVVTAPAAAAGWLLLGTALAALLGGAAILPPLARLGAATPTMRQIAALFRRDMLIVAWFVAATLLFLVDRVLLKDLLGPAGAAQYVLLADVLQRGAQFLLAPMVIALQPIVARHVRGGDLAAAHAAVGRSVALQLAAVVVALSVLMLLREPLLQALLGVPEPGAIASFVPLLLAAAAWQAAQAVQKTIEYAGQLRALTLAAFAALGVLVVVTLVAVPGLGSAGAAWASFAAVGVYAAAVGHRALAFRRGTVAA